MCFMFKYGIINKENLSALNKDNMKKPKDDTVNEDRALTYGLRKQSVDSLEAISGHN